MLTEEEVFVTSGKNKAIVRKETVAVSAMIPKIVRKNQNTLPPYFPSQPFHEVEVCRGREASEAKSIRGAILRQPCRYYLKGTCTRSPCEYWHPPECQFYKKETGCKSGDKCCFRITRLMNNQIQGRRKATSSQKKRERDDKNVVAIVKIVPQLGCVSQDSESLDSQRDRQSQGNPMQKVLGPIRRVCFTRSSLRQASIGENRGPSLGKIQVKNPHQRSPYAMKFECRSQEETARHQRCAQSKAWNLA